MAEKYIYCLKLFLKAMKSSLKQKEFTKIADN